MSFSSTRIVSPSWLAGAAILLGLGGCGGPPPPPAPPVNLVWGDESKLPPRPKIVGWIKPEPPGRPSPVLAIPPPKPPPKDYRGRDLSKLPAPLLATMAYRLADEGKFREAAHVQYWAVQAGGTGQRLLACWTAQGGDLDSAFYWLQDAALSDSAEPDWAGRAFELVPLRDDPRWPTLAPYLRGCYDYWRSSGVRREVLILPKDYKLGTPIGVVVAMHAQGSKPEGFFGEPYRKFADELDMAFLSVSATFPIGKNSFTWAEDPAMDSNHIRRALKDMSDRLTVDPAHVVLYGYSQGGQMAFEMAYQLPDVFRGAIAVSPGTIRSFDRFELLTAPSPAHKAQGYVFLCGSEEQPAHIDLVRRDAAFVSKAGARVELKVYEGLPAYSLPPDFMSTLVGRIRFVDGSAQP